MTDYMSDNNSSLHVVVYVSSVSLYDGKVKSLSGRGKGHLFLHLLAFAGLSLMLLFDDSLGS